MPSLNYPYTFQCLDCSERTVIKRTDAEEICDEPDSHTALNTVLKHRGWVQAFNGIFCPDCAGSAD